MARTILYYTRAGNAPFPTIQNIFISTLHASIFIQVFILTLLYSLYASIFIHSLHASNLLFSSTFSLHASIFITWFYYFLLYSPFIHASIFILNSLHASIFIHGIIFTLLFMLLFSSRVLLFSSISLFYISLFNPFSLTSIFYYSHLSERERVGM